MSTSISKMWSDLQIYKVSLWNVCELYPGLSSFDALVLVMNSKNNWNFSWLL